MCIPLFEIQHCPMAAKYKSLLVVYIQCQKRCVPFKFSGEMKFTDTQALKGLVVFSEPV